MCYVYYYVDSDLQTICSHAKIQLVQQRGEGRILGNYKHTVHKSYHLSRILCIHHEPLHTKFTIEELITRTPTYLQVSCSWHGEGCIEYVHTQSQIHTCGATLCSTILVANLVIKSRNYRGESLQGRQNLLYLQTSVGRGKARRGQR